MCVEPLRLSEDELTCIRLAPLFRSGRYLRTRDWQTFHQPTRQPPGEVAVQNLTGWVQADTKPGDHTAHIGLWRWPPLRRLGAIEAS
jgi:hypothetical protein